MSDEYLYGDSLLQRTELFEISLNITTAEIDTVLITSSSYNNGFLSETLEYRNTPRSRVGYEFYPEANKLWRITTFFTDHTTNEDTLIRFHLFQYDQFGHEYHVSYSDSSGLGHRIWNTWFYHNLYNEVGLPIFSYGVNPVGEMGWQATFQKFEYDSLYNLTKTYKCESDDESSCTLESVTVFNNKGQPTLRTDPRSKSDSISYIYNEYGLLLSRTSSMSSPFGSQNDIYTYEYDELGRPTLERHRLIQASEYVYLRKYYYNKN